MDVLGSEIGQKMRSAIKAKLTELGCYVDDELPDYVMVMVANKRTRSQMEEDLQLFLSDNTVTFVKWLHQVLKKLQEVTITTPIINVPDQSAVAKPSKDKEKVKKSKDKKSKIKEKHKKSDHTKKSKKSKSKEHKKKSDKKIKKHKKIKETEVIRPNIPPLFMNMEKESEPSITDVFAGQILKNHGVTVDMPKEEPMDKKQKVDDDVKRPILPLIDPASIGSPNNTSESPIEPAAINGNSKETAPCETQLKEITQIEAKIQGLRHKLAEQLDNLSDEEDLLSIRPEPDELMTDFADDVFQEIRAARVSSMLSPPLMQLESNKSMTPSPTPAGSGALSAASLDTLPVIELNLPKRPMRERLVVKSSPAAKTTLQSNKTDNNQTSAGASQNFKIVKPVKQSAKSRLGELVHTSTSTSSNKSESSSESSSSESKKTSKRRLHACATPSSVVNVQPRSRKVGGASTLLMRAMADAQKSLRNVSSKGESSSALIRRALVHPIRRTIDNQKIVIEVPAGRDKETITVSRDADAKATEKMAYEPRPLQLAPTNSTYVPSRRSAADTDTVLKLNLHNTSPDGKGPNFVVTLDGLDPNLFLTNKLKNEGLIDDNGQIKDFSDDEMQSTKSECSSGSSARDSPMETESSESPPRGRKRLSGTSEDSDTQVIIKNDDTMEPFSKRVVQKRKNSDSTDALEMKMDTLDSYASSSKRRRASPIVFDVPSSFEQRRPELVAHAPTATTSAAAAARSAPPAPKYETLPTPTERKTPCRTFPMCRFGAQCVFLHPPCKFAASCTRRGCLFSHPLPAAPVAPETAAATSYIASHVVPAANYKSVSAVPMMSPMCKFFPHCANPTCHFYHPKPCRFGKACANQPECNFYHHDPPSLKWRAPV